MVSSAVRPQAVSRGGHSNPDRELGAQQSDDKDVNPSTNLRDALSVAEAKSLARCTVGKTARCVVGPHIRMDRRGVRRRKPTAGRPGRGHPVPARCGASPGVAGRLYDQSLAAGRWRSALQVRGRPIPGVPGVDERACRIDERVAPHLRDLVVEKENASAFFGTHLVPYLIGHGVDTLLITGCSTSACIRTTATDAKSYRFRPIIVRECVGDRSPVAHHWTLFDIQARFADVVPLEEALAYVSNLDARFDDHEFRLPIRRTSITEMNRRQSRGLAIRPTR